MSDRAAAPPGRLFYGWWIVLSTAAINLFQAGTFGYGFGLLFQPLSTEFGWTSTQISLAMALRSEVGAIGALAVGFGIDRFGVRRTLTLGVCIVAIGFGALSQVRELVGFYLAMCLIAAGSSAAGGGVGQIAISRWFVQKRSRALSVMTLGAGFSGIMVPPLALLITTFGWRAALMAMAAGMLLICLPLAQWMRDRPEELGLWPDGGDTPPVYGIDLEHKEGRPARDAHELPGMTAREALGSREFWFMIAAIGPVSLANNAVTTYQVPLLQHAGMSTALAAISVTGLTMMSVLGRLGFGWLGDFWDKRRVLALCFALQAAGTFIAANIGPLWMVIPFLLTFSPGFGGPIPVRGALFAEYFGTRSLGSIQGSFAMANTVIALMGPILVGYLYDTTGSYTTAFLVVAAGSAAAIPVVLTAPRPRRFAAVSAEAKPADERTP